MNKLAIKVNATLVILCIRTQHDQNPTTHTQLTLLQNNTEKQTNEENQTMRRHSY